MKQILAAILTYLILSGAVWAEHASDQLVRFLSEGNIATIASQAATTHMMMELNDNLRFGNDLTSGGLMGLEQKRSFPVY